MALLSVATSDAKALKRVAQRDSLVRRIVDMYRCRIAQGCEGCWLIEAAYNTRIPTLLAKVYCNGDVRRLRKFWEERFPSGPNPDVDCEEDGGRWFAPEFKNRGLGFRV